MQKFLHGLRLADFRLETDYVYRMICATHPVKNGTPSWPIRIRHRTPDCMRVSLGLVSHLPA